MVIGKTEGVLPVLLHTKTRREHSQSSSDLSPFSSHRVPKKSTHNSFNLSGQRFCAAAVAAALHYTEGEVHQFRFNPLLMKKDRVCLYVIAFFSYRIVASASLFHFEAYVGEARNPDFFLFTVCSF